MGDLGAQPGPDRRHRALELVQDARDQRALATVADVVEHPPGGESVLYVPQHRAARPRVGEAAQRLVQPRRRLAPGDQRSVAQPRRLDPAVPGQHVIEPGPVHDVAVGPLGPQLRHGVSRLRRTGRGGLTAGAGTGPGRAPWERHAQARVGRRHVQGRLGLHVQDPGVLGRVGDLEDRQRLTVGTVEGERPVALATEVARRRGRHAEARPGQPNRIRIRQRGPRRAQHRIHGERRYQRRRCSFHLHSSDENAGGIYG